MENLVVKSNCIFMDMLVNGYLTLSKQKYKKYQYIVQASDIYLRACIKWRFCIRLSLYKIIKKCSYWLYEVSISLQCHVVYGIKIPKVNIG